MKTSRPARPKRIANRVRDLTEADHYRSIERLAGLLFVDDLLHHNHSATVEQGRCGGCGYEMNYYDVIYYTVKVGIHPRERIKELLKQNPREILDVTFKDIQCVECGAAMDVVITGYLCVWKTEDLGKEVSSTITRPLPRQGLTKPVRG